MLNIIENFPILFDSKEKVKELRNLILTMAIQGKLVPQDPKDEPASVLLKRIEDEKKRLVKEKKIKKATPLPHISEDEKPFELPNGWEWVRLANIIIDSIGGGTPSKNNPTYWNGTIPWASVKDLNNEIYLSGTLDYITEKGLTNSSSNLIPANNIIICTRMGLGKININIIDVAINQDLRALFLSKYICQMYFFYFYKTRNILGQGMTVKGIKQKELLGFAVPIPPLLEQHRIVQKIDELMALCDELEKALEKKAQSKELAAKSISNLIQKSENQEQLKTNLTLLINMFKQVYSTKNNIKDLRDTILQLAIQGKLVPQDPNDEPASVLLKRIEEEKKKLLKEKKIKKEPPLPPISEDEKPFNLPKGWEWVRFGKIINLISGQHIESNLYNNKGDGVPYLTGPTDFGTKYTIITKWTEHPKVMVSKGDILITVKGSGVGKVNILNEDASIGRQLMSIRGLAIHKSFCYYYLLSKVTLFQQLKVGIAIPGIGRDDILNQVIALPPLDEQLRIIHKIDELMVLCDELENHIENTVHHSDDLIKAIIKTAI